MPYGGIPTMYKCRHKIVPEGRMMRLIRNAKFQNLAAVSISVLIGLLIFELFIRVSGLWVKDAYDKRTYFTESNISGVPYILKPNIHAVWAKTDIITNFDGIRDRREFGDKNRNTFRILSIGDSITFGFGIDQDETYPKQMEYLLNKYKKSDKIYEVINAGISGFNASDEANLLEYLNSKYKPDLILWFITGNDFDDSLSVNEKGQMTHSKPGYAATSEWLRLAWGLKGRYIYADNFLKSMREPQQCWALGKKYVEKKSVFGKIDSILRRRLYSYCFVASRLKGTYGYKNEGHIPNERIIVTNIPSIIISPYYKRRFDNAILKGIRSAKESNTPLVLLSFDMLVENKEINDVRKIYFQDITEYLAMPYHRFRSLYNLGWDGHFNNKGNKLLAKAIVQYLSHTGLIDADIERVKDLYDKKDFWVAYNSVRDTYIDGLKSWIDFKGFQNIHQIIGGIYPPCIFPIKDNAKASFVLGSCDSNIFHISGTNNGEEQDINIWISNGKDSIERILNIESGVFDLWFEIPETINGNGKVIDVQIKCASNVCGNIKLDYIGWRGKNT
jgi:lysophospholipase L1-like esterase